jgi:hypothetical protein
LTQKKRGYAFLAAGLILMVVGMVLVGATIYSLATAGFITYARVESGSPSGAVVSINDVTTGTNSGLGTQVSLTYQHGDVLEFMATAPSGFQFDYWQGVGYDTGHYTDNPLEMTMTGSISGEGAVDTTYYAYFTTAIVPPPSTYAVTFTAENGGYIKWTDSTTGLLNTVSGTSTVYFNANDALSILAVADQNFQFSYFSSSTSGTTIANPLQTTVTSAFTVSAYFTQAAPTPTPPGSTPTPTPTVPTSTPTPTPIAPTLEQDLTGAFGFILTGLGIVFVLLSRRFF